MQKQGRTRRSRRPVTTGTGTATRVGRPPVVDRERLLDAAEGAIRRHGPTVSLERIAAKAGVTKPVLFAHVGNRRALVHALAERLLTRIEAAIGAALATAAGGRHSLESVIRAELETIAEHGDLYAFVNGAGTGDMTLDSTLAFARRSAEPLIAGIAQDRKSRGLDPAPAEAWGYAIIGMLHMAGLWWVQKSATERDARRLAAQLTDLAWEGLAPRS
ncbi:MAG TPA: TetR/AcrR family transcriptional regulator [Candidatus Binataceae bacterium]|nr:TetR/AcrR family transcriptional regulator [Candidatus Binataceae bacterium]